MIDFGITLAGAPPVTSAVLIQMKAGSRRRQLGIFGPEQADGMLYGNMSPKIELVVKKEDKTTEDDWN